MIYFLFELSSAKELKFFLSFIRKVNTIITECPSVEHSYQKKNKPPTNKKLLWIWHWTISINEARVMELFGVRSHLLVAITTQSTLISGSSY